MSEKSMSDKKVSEKRMTGKMMFNQLTIGSIIRHAARYHGRTEVVSVETTGGLTRSTWAKVEQNARKLASAMEQLGIEQDQRCATIAWNNVRHLEIYYAAAGSGRVTHTINPRLSPEQLIYIINHAEDKILFLDKTFLPIITGIREHLTTVDHVVMMGPRDAESEAILDGSILFYDELVTTGNDDYIWPEVDENSPASLCYTSGTTGNPKGVEYTHRSTVLHCLAGGQADAFAIVARDTILPVVPMFHVAAWGVPYNAAMTGAKLVLPGPGLDGDSLVKLIDDEQVTMAFGVPTIWLGLLSALEASGSKAESLTRTVVGGSALPPYMIAAFRDKYGIELIHAWGMTELSPLGTLNQLLQKHTDLSVEDQEQIRLSQGRPPWGIELRLVDTEGNILAEDGETQGDLQVRGHWVVDTYFGAEDSTLTADGWFDTGDVATINEDGYMVIRDRSKDIIKSGGEWISTVELENIAIAHSGVANAAVIAAHHTKWAERPLLIVMKAPDADPSEQELLDFYEGKLASWQVPDAVLFIDELPLGATGKVLKNKLRERYQNYYIESGK